MLSGMGVSDEGEHLDLSAQHFVNYGGICATFIITEGGIFPEDTGDGVEHPTVTLASACAHLVESPAPLLLGGPQIHIFACIDGVGGTREEPRHIPVEMQLTVTHIRGPHHERIIQNPLLFESFQ